MAVQADGRAGQVPASAVAQARKPVAKTADFKNSLARAQLPFAMPALARTAPRNGPVAAAGTPAQPAAPRAGGPAAALLAQEARGTATPARRVALAVPRPAARPPGQADTGDSVLRARIALLESGREPNQGYAARNARSGALGRYQMLPIALRDIGWQDAQGRWTAAAARQGVTSEASFLANPSAQEAAMDAYLQRKTAQLSANGALTAVGTTVIGTDGRAVPLTEAGLIAAAHRRGAGAVARWLEHRRNNPEAPAPAAQRVAFANVEQRLRDFAAIPYGADALLAARRGAGQPAI
ncbi:hypothetical protein LPC08_21745 [Roseomonas sp. OT10]|uniref:hypothetical protein n=1 Tax=Roseomonas cutis TaxID=2897332 RepID=UPI001E5C4E48|nr:hypothetical protein [Roseomonas sp. OT10]UFN48604.1 hypothetical protein LPC08_21745 [Roseomonas sp. OT10]